MYMYSDGDSIIFPSMDLPVKTEYVVQKMEQPTARTTPVDLIPILKNKKVSKTTKVSVFFQACVSTVTVRRHDAYT